MLIIIILASIAAIAHCEETFFTEHERIWSSSSTTIESSSAVWRVGAALATALRCAWRARATSMTLEERIAGEAVANAYERERERERERREKC